MEKGDLGEGVSLIDPLADQRWDRFVDQHPFGWITHLSGWKSVLEGTFPHMRGYYLTLCDSAGLLKAALPIYSVQSWLTGRRLVSIPFATLSDPLATDPADMERLFAAALNLSRRLAMPRMEIRTFSAPYLLDRDKYITDSRNKHHSLYLCDDPELVKHSFHRTCVRQRIHRAEQSGLRIVSGRTEDDLQQFYLLHRMTRKRHALPPQPYLFIKAIWQTFADGGKAELLLAYKEDVALAGIIVFRYKGRVSVEFSAVDTDYNHYSPIPLLLWNSIRDSCLSGYRVLDFGRTSASNKTLLDFKSHWGTRVSDLQTFFYPKLPVHNTRLTDHLVAQKIFQYVCNKAPDNALGYLGDFCYRHLG
jgi:hypothetical protein